MMISICLKKTACEPRGSGPEPFQFMPRNQRHKLFEIEGQVRFARLVALCRCRQQMLLELHVCVASPLAPLALLFPTKRCMAPYRPILKPTIAKLEPTRNVLNYSN